MSKDGQLGGRWTPRPSPPRRDSPRDPCEGVPPTSKSCRASFAGLAAREPSVAAHAGLASRSAELLIDPVAPSRNGSMTQTPALQNSFSTSAASKPPPGGGSPTWEQNGLPHPAISTPAKWEL